MDRNIDCTERLRCTQVSRAFPRFRVVVARPLGPTVERSDRMMRQAYVSDASAPDQSDQGERRAMHVLDYRDRRHTTRRNPGQSERITRKCPVRLLPSIR